MSYHVRFDMLWSGGDLDSGNEKDVDRVLACVREYVAREGRYAVEDFLADFREALMGETALINHWYEPYAVEVMKFVSSHFPETLFGVRGVGEEFDDVWVRYFKNGRVHERRPDE
jgi:hypothetical protein